MSERRRHRFRPYSRFSFNGNKAMRWCIDCLSVEQVATYEERQGGRAIVTPDGVTHYRKEPLPESFELVDIKAYGGADPEWCSAKKWERRKTHRLARRDAR